MEPQAGATPSSTSKALSDASTCIAAMSVTRVFELSRRPILPSCSPMGEEGSSRHAAAPIRLNARQKFQMFRRINGSADNCFR